MWPLSLQACQVAVVTPCLSPQPPLLGDSDPSLSDSDSEESVFSGLEDSGSDTSEDDSEGVDGTGRHKDDDRTEETSEEQPQVGEGGAPVGPPVHECGQKQDTPSV